MNLNGLEGPRKNYSENDWDDEEYNIDDVEYDEDDDWEDFKEDDEDYDIEFDE